MSCPGPPHRTQSLVVGLLLLLAMGSVLGGNGFVWAGSGGPAPGDRTKLRVVALAPDDERPSIAVHHNPRVAFAPGAVQTRIDVARHPENRRLRVIIESARYYGSSELQLNGSASPRSHFLVWKRLPPGGYRLEATVFGAGGVRDRLVLETGFRVVER